MVCLEGVSTLMCFMIPSAVRVSIIMMKSVAHLITTTDDVKILGTHCKLSE